MSASIERGRHSVRPFVVLGLLTLVYTFNFMDRQLLSILAEPIRRDLNLSDTQLGLVGGIIFALFYTTLGIPLAWVADRTHRVRVVALACSFWSLCSAACGLAHSFTQLAISRIGVGAGEAGASPPAHSIISDYFPASRRGTALAIYSVGVPVGVLLASLAGGATAAAFGWRAAFAAVGLPGVIVALLVLLFIPEPRRGRLDGGSADRVTRHSLVAAVQIVLTDRTMTLAGLAAAASAFVGYALTWMPTFLIRDRSMSLAEIALWYSLATGIGSMIGTFLSGWVADRFAPLHPGAYGLVPCFAHLISLPFFLAALLMPSWPAALACYIVPGSLSNVFLAPGYAIFQNRAPASLRAVASALLLFTLNLIGLGGGPLFVGMVSDHFRPAAGEQSLSVGLAALAPFFLVAALLHFLTARALARKTVPGGTIEECSTGAAE